jgi:rfaE bifunctional protein kinase chain/domain
MNARELIEKMKATRILVVGDPIVDKYVFGSTPRLCPEGPIPVFVPEKVEVRNGGAAHVSDQIHALCSEGWQFFGTPSMKTRYMAGHHLVGLRVDEDQPSAATDAQKIESLGKAFKAEPRFDAIIISDYAKGWITAEFCKWIVRYAKENQIPVIVDPKGKDWTKYQGCTLICPNMVEIKIHQDGTLFPCLLLKCGDAGVTLYTPSGSKDFPATAKHVFDVTGAGDVVVAVAAAVIGSGGSLRQAAWLSNIAAGWSVGEVGTVCITREKLLELVSEQEVEIE